MRDRFNAMLPGAPDWAQDALIAFLAASLAVLVALLVHAAIFRVLRRITLLSQSETDDIVLEKLSRPVRYALIALAIVLAARELPFLAGVWERVAGFVMPALIGWIAYAIFHALILTMEHRAEAGTELREERRRKTRLTILSRIGTFLIVLVTLALMLLSIPAVRDVGVTMMASAGLAALAVGAAAQPALKSLIAGVQTAITEPIRIGDMVVVDGHTGRIEDITMSFVVVRIWDERTVIVPTSRFLEDSFENWSRQSELLTGPVFLHLDPTTEIAPIRAELERHIATQELWDGRTASLLLTEAHPESLELRIAVSARTIGELWDLRCAVREHMVGWLQREMPEALIRHRLEVQAANERVAES